MRIFWASLEDNGTCDRSKGEEVYFGITQQLSIITHLHQQLFLHRIYEAALPNFHVATLPTGTDQSTQPSVTMATDMPALASRPLTP